AEEHPAPPVAAEGLDGETQNGVERQPGDEDLAVKALSLVEGEQEEEEQKLAHALVELRGMKRRRMPVRQQVVLVSRVREHLLVCQRALGEADAEEEIFAADLSPTAARGDAAHAAEEMAQG